MTTITIHRFFDHFYSLQYIPFIAPKNCKKFARVLKGNLTNYFDSWYDFPNIRFDKFRIFKKLKLRLSMSHFRRKPQKLKVKGKVVGAPQGYRTESKPIDGTHQGKTWSKIQRWSDKVLLEKSYARKQEKASLIRREEVWTVN